jgi:hypothetical protein
MRTYKLYQVDIIMNAPIFTYIAEVQAADFASAETQLLALVPANNVEYIITIVK